MLHTCDGKIACDTLRCIFQHVGNFAPIFGISQPIIFRFSKGFYHNAGDLMSFHLICVSKVCVIFLNAITAMRIAEENGNLPS